MMGDYRKFLVAAEQKSQEDFDKTVLSLSGGALGISFVFLKDVIGTNTIQFPSLLLAAWICWAFSSLSVLLSFHMSRLALRVAIGQVDNGTIYKATPGGKYASLTAGLNVAGALLFVAGIVSITAFVAFNVPSKGASDVKQQVQQTAPPPGSASTKASQQPPPAAIDGGVRTPPAPATR